MSEEQLSPCHFCGSSEVRVLENYEGWFVVCIKCGCRGLGQSDDKQTIIDAWNKDRFASADFNIKKAKKCPFCGSHPELHQVAFFGKHIRLEIKCRKTFCDVGFDRIIGLEKFNPNIKYAVFAALVQKWNRKYHESN